MKNGERFLAKKDTVMWLLAENHCGSHNAIKATDIKSKVGVSAVELRSIVNALRQEEIPICSDENGYYFAGSVSDVRSTINHLDARIKGIKKATYGLKMWVHYAELGDE